MHKCSRKAWEHAHSVLGWALQVFLKDGPMLGNSWHHEYLEAAQGNVRKLHSSLP